MKTEKMYELLDYPGYVVTKTGKIYSMNGQKERKNKMMEVKPFVMKSGYGQITLCCDKKRFKRYIHRIIAKQLISNPEEKPEVNHKDGNKMNNNIENLEWTSQSENALHMFNELNPSRKKATGFRNMNSNSVAKYDMDGKHIQDYENIAEAAKEGFHYSGISKCASGKRKHYGGFIWKKIENTKKEEFLKMMQERARNFSEKSTNKNARRKQVSCYDLDGKLIKEFESITAAERCGFSRVCIFDCINGRAKTHMKLIWKEIK